MAHVDLWVMIISVAIVTFTFRFSFFALLRDKQLPEWAMRHLRYVAVAIIPGMIALMVYNPNVENAAIDPARMISILTGLIVGFWSKNPLAIMLSCAIVFVGATALGIGG